MFSKRHTREHQNKKTQNIRQHKPQTTQKTTKTATPQTLSKQKKTSHTKDDKKADGRE